MPLVGFERTSSDFKLKKTDHDLEECRLLECYAVKTSNLTMWNPLHRTNL
jgi:hypothetical protein